MRSQMKKVLRSLPWVIGSFGFIIMFVVGPYVIDHMMASLSHAPNPATGAVIAFNQHGVMLYLTSDQQLRITLWRAAGFLIIGIAAALHASLKASTADWKYSSK